MTDGLMLLSQARSNLCAYACATDPRFKPNRMTRYISRRLEEAMEKEYGRIIFQAPPQHGKSMMVSQKFPSWALGVRPDCKIIAGSYGDDLVQLNGQSVRNSINSPLHKMIFPDSEISSSTRAKDYFLTTQGGQYLGVTIRGGGTGFPSDIFLIDDPFKSRAEAESEAFRNHIKDWYTSVVYTRLAKKSILVIMHTRWHNDDLVGWLLKEHANENWELINMPAIAEEDDILGREPGEALVPERFSVEDLEKKRIAVGSRDWISLYQQRPTEQGGSVFKHEWLKYYKPKDVEPTIWQMNRYLLIDPARTKSSNSDYTAMLVIGLHSDGNYYLIDAVYDRLGLSERGKAIMELHRTYRPLQTGFKKTGSEGDIEYLYELQNSENYRFPIIPITEKGAKESRIERLAPDFEAGKIWLPESLWKMNSQGENKNVISQFVEDEYMPFPAAKHDDFFDCLSSIKDIDLRWPKTRRITRRKTSNVLIV